jgi:hypothetical protein
MSEIEGLTMSLENGSQLPDGLPLVTDAALISRSPSVLTAEVDGEVLIMSIDRGNYFSLNEIACDIWRRLDPPCSFAELIDGLAADYDANRATIVDDVRVLLRRLVAEDIVRVG